MITVCWVAGAGVGFLPLFGWHSVSERELQCYFVKVMDYDFLLFLYFATIITPSALLAAFYAHIYRVVVKQLSETVRVSPGARAGAGGGTMLRVLGAAQKREVKATQNLAVIVFFFMICWIPLYTINAIKAFWPDCDIHATYTEFCILLSHLNSAVNPLLYAYHLKDFRAALEKLLCGARKPPPPGKPSQASRPALERCNALRDRPRLYVDSPVWMRQQAELAVAAMARLSPPPPSDLFPDAEPFLPRPTADGSSGRRTPDGRDSDTCTPVDLGPYLIEEGGKKPEEQSPFRRVEELLRRVRRSSGGGES